MAIRSTIGGASLVEVLDRVLDKGIVIDAWVRVSVVGIEILAVEARVVVASVDTYLKYADAIGVTANVARPRFEVPEPEERLLPYATPQTTLESGRGKRAKVPARSARPAAAPATA